MSAWSGQPGEIIWSRIYIEDDKLKMDLGRAGVVALPIEETERRWAATMTTLSNESGLYVGILNDTLLKLRRRVLGLGLGKAVAWDRWWVLLIVLGL